MHCALSKGIEVNEGGVRGGVWVEAQIRADGCLHIIKLKSLVLLK